MSARVSFSSREIAPPLVERRLHLPRPATATHSPRQPPACVAPRDTHRESSGQEPAESIAQHNVTARVELRAHTSELGRFGWAGPLTHPHPPRCARVAASGGGDLHKAISPPDLACYPLFASFLHPSSYCHARCGPRPYAAPCCNLVWPTSWPRTPRATSTPCRPNPSRARRRRIILRGYHQEQR